MKAFTSRAQQRFSAHGIKVTLVAGHPKMELPGIGIRNITTNDAYKIARASEKSTQVLEGVIRNIAELVDPRVAAQFAFDA